LITVPSLILLLIELQIDFHRVAVALQQGTTHKIAYIMQNNIRAQTKDSIQSYKNNKGHITHSEYNTQIK
jgi:hypothetical protein